VPAQHLGERAIGRREPQTMRHEPSAVKWASKDSRNLETKTIAVPVDYPARLKAVGVL